MIQVTRINHIPMVLNADLIEHVESTPDTVISLTNGQKFVVLESAEDIVDRVVEFRRRIASEMPGVRGREVQASGEQASAVQGSAVQESAAQKDVAQDSAAQQQEGSRNA